MATALRTGASRASAVLSKPATSPARSVKPGRVPHKTKKLMVDMHRSLYPHMYDGAGKPTRPIEMPRSTIRSRTVGLNQAAERLMRRHREERLNQFYRKTLRRTCNPVNGLVNRRNHPFSQLTRHPKTTSTNRSHRKRLHLQTTRPRHQKNLPRPNRRRSKLANRTPRSNRCSHPPLREREPRVRACRRHPARAAAHGRPLCRRVHQHPPPGRRHSDFAARPANARGCRDVV